MEFLHGRPLSPEELDLIRQQLEGMDDVTAIDPEMRAIVKVKVGRWPTYPIARLCRGFRLGTSMHKDRRHHVTRQSDTLTRRPVGGTV
jgi:hypothetical protein